MSATTATSLSFVQICDRMESYASDLAQQLNQYSMLGRSRRKGFTRVDLRRKRDELRGVFDFVAFHLIDRQWPDDGQRQLVIDVLALADNRLQEQRCRLQEQR